jgi:hypothetical protein
VTGNWLEECGFPKADSIYQHALRLQRRAGYLLRDEECRLALEYTQAARRNAFEAVVLCFGVEGLCLRTQVVVTRTAKAIEFLDSLIRDCDQPQAKLLFLKGVELEKNALEAQGQGHCPQALELTLSARTLIFKAAYLCHEDGAFSASFPDFGEIPEDAWEEEASASNGLLKQNSPNPFNAQTTITFSLPTDSKVSLTVYNIRSQKVKTLVDEFQSAGEKQVIWDGSNESGDKVASGVYFYRIQTDEVTEVRRMVFLK